MVGRPSPELAYKSLSIKATTILAMASIRPLSQVSRFNHFTPFCSVDVFIHHPLPTNLGVFKRGSGKNGGQTHHKKFNDVFRNGKIFLDILYLFVDINNVEATKEPGYFCVQICPSRFHLSWAGCFDTNHQ